MNSIKSQMVIDYITKVNKAISNPMVVEEKEDIFDLLIEIANVFQNEIPEIQSSILLRNGTETRDANTVVGLLKLYLANNKVQFTRDYTGQRSDGRGAARQIFHVIFKLSLVAAMVVIIKSTTRRLSSKDTFSQVSR